MLAEFGKSSRVQASSALPRTLGPKAASVTMTMTIAAVIRPNTPPTPAQPLFSLNEQQKNRFAETLPGSDRERDSC
jgi:hypothetical protein